MPNILIAYLSLLVSSVIRQKRLIHFCFIGLAYFFSLRTNLIPDTDDYENIYNNTLDHEGVFEYGFLLLCDFFHDLLDVDFMVFYVIITFITMELWYYASKKLFCYEDDNLFVLFLLFMSFYGFFYLGVTTRNAISLVLVYNAYCIYLYYSDYVGKAICLALLLLATTFHNSAWLFILLLPFLETRLSTDNLYTIFFICMALWLFSGFSFARGLIMFIQDYSGLSKLEEYTDVFDVNTNTLSIQNIVAFTTSFVFIGQRDYIWEEYEREYDLFLKINLVGLAILSFLWTVPTAYRFYGLFFFFNFVLIYMVCFKNIRMFSMLKQYSMCAVFSLVYFATLIYCNIFMLLY